MRKEQHTYISVDRPRAACYKESCKLFTCGPVAQLGARMTGSHEVESSNLSRSTIYPIDY